MTRPPVRETLALAERYARRLNAASRYDYFKPDVWQTVQERQRALLRLWTRQGWTQAGERRLTEVGCGGGSNLLELLRMGFAPAHLTGIELLPERLAHARQVLPAAVRLLEGDACEADVPAASQDAVAQFTVFSSLLDDAFQQRLADAMWLWLKPGGGVLWYDFAIDNPRNPDVRGVPLHRVRQLFPAGTLTSVQRVTLAPPLARAVCRLHPALYGVFNCLPLLRTHRLVWIEKPHS